ncbi:MAG: MFS transporter [Bacteroidota bacterium]
MADTIGRKPVIFFGVLMSFACGMMYPLLATVAGFLFLRLLHGFSTGFAPTGNSAFVADIVPAQRRGEAMGILGLTSNIGTAIGPALGSEIAVAFSINVTFYTAACCAILSLLIIMRLREPLDTRQAFSPHLLKINKDDIIEPRVLSPAFVTFLALFAFGCILTVIPDYSEFLGMRNKGVFFTFYTGSSLIVRFVAGKISDYYGRVIIIKWGLVFLILGMLILAFSQKPWHLLSGACVYGVAVGFFAPTIFAWAIDLSHEQGRGKALSTIFIALEIGIGLGALSSGWIYANEYTRLPWVFFVSAFFAGIALIYLQLKYRSRSKNRGV